MHTIWLVVPCYNEETRLDLERFSEILHALPNLHLCMVDDCSTDGTYTLLSNLAKDKRVTVLQNIKNSGKAASVRTGILHGIKHCNCEYFAYWDADLATPFSELTGMYHALVANKNLMMVMGSRVNILGRNIVRKQSRHYIGRIFATIASFILANGVYDTQCGAKIFTREFAAITFTEKLITDWCFDIELLVRLQRHYREDSIIKRKVLEYPLHTWIDIDGSKVKLYHLFRIAKDLFNIYRLKKS